ncbi:rRNA maturation RNase YbeY [Hoeflea sp. CAU 1731]
MNSPAQSRKLLIELSVEGGQWEPEGVLSAMCERVLGSAADYLAEHGQPFPEYGTEVSMLFTEDEEMRLINGRWRSKDTPTNVLSFPSAPLEPGHIPGVFLGDIVLAYETIAREAESLEIPFDNHLTHLLVHGLLHLLGYDHIHDGQARVMENLETRILAKLNLSDPYEDTDPV